MVARFRHSPARRWTAFSRVSGSTTRPSDAQQTAPSWHPTVPIQEEQEPTLLEQINDATTLTWSQRMTGFAVCFTLGMICSFSSTMFIWHFDAVHFAVTYTVGNILSVSSTAFLMGPANQMKRMFKARRIWATLMYLVMIVMTLVFALAVKDPMLVIICVILQLIALVWYAASYIPFAQRMLKNCCGGCCDFDDGI